MTTFDTVSGDHGPGYALVHRIGRRLWLPMLLVAVAAFASAWVLGVLEAATTAAVDSPADFADVARLRHLAHGLGLAGFAGVLAATSCAVARLLGALRKGGRELQEAAGGDVLTLRATGIARAFAALVALGLATLGVAVVLHVVAALAADAANVDRALAEWVTWLAALGRIGLGLLLAGIALGLASVVHVLRFDAVRLRELAE